MVTPSTRNAISLPNSSADVLDGGAGVLDAVVQQARAHRRHVELQLGDDARHAERVRDVGIAGAPALARVPLGREGEAAFDETDVRGAVVRLNGGDDLLYVAHCDEDGGPPSRDLASASSACP